MHSLDCSQFTRLRQVGGELEVFNIPTLGASLEDPAVTSHCVGQLLTFLHRHAAGFLTVDILTRSSSEDGAKCVPPIAGRNQNSIYIVTVENLEHVTALDTILIAVVAVYGAPNNLAALFLHIGD